MSLKRNQTGFKHVIAPFFRALVAFVLVVGLLPTMVFTFVEPAEALALTDAPSYYRPLMDGGSPVQDDAGNPVYYYDEVVGSSGVLDTRYRVYDKDDEEWYPCDATGTPTGGGALTLADFATERPQPGYWVNTATTTPAQRYVNLTRAAMSGEQVLKATNITGNFVEQTGYPVSSGANRNVAYGSIYPGALIEYDFVGKYRFNYAASANGFSAGGNMMQDGFLRDERVPGDIPFIEDTRYGCGLTTTSAGGLNAVKANGVERGNGSYATLVAPQSADTKIYRAYLVMQTMFDLESLTGTSGTNEVMIGSPILNTYVERYLQDMANRPMTLVGPSGDAMLSNGYLPEGFKVTYNASTVGTSLNKNAPAIIWERPDGMSSLAQRVRAVTITDVTDFVQEQGYGRYYGYNVPVKFGCNYSMNTGTTATLPPAPLTHAMYSGVPRYNQGTAAANPAGPTHGSGNFADMACGWQIIVVEEDPSMEYVRAGALQLGTVYNFKEQPPVVLEADFAGFTTPYDDFTGQILFTDFGANVGINQCQVHLSPDGTGTSNASDFNANWASAPTQPGNANNGWLLGSEWVDLWTSDKSTAPKHRNRPQTPPNLEISSNSFGQSIITLDGQRRSDFSSYRTYSANGTTAIGTPFGHINRADGFDAELLEVANKVPANGHHNAYFAEGAKKISLRVPQSQGGTNFIVSLGALTDISIAKFEVDITHEDLGPVAKDSGEVDIYAGNNVEVKAHAENRTPDTGSVIGLDMTQVVIDVDESLVPDWDTLSISFYSAENDDTYTTAEYIRADNLADLEDGGFLWHYDDTTRKLTINWGVESDTHGDTLKLLSVFGDTLDVTFEALTDETPLLDITNEIVVQGTDAVTKDDHIRMDLLEYAWAKDSFDTYKYPEITKQAFINGSSTATNGTEANPVSVEPGGRITYVIELTNQSNKFFTDIEVSDLVPAGLTVTSIDPTAPDGAIGTPNAAGKTPVSWGNVLILPGSAETPTINTYTIETTVASAGRIFENDALYEMDHEGDLVTVPSEPTYSESDKGYLEVTKTVIGDASSQSGDSFSITVTVQKSGTLLEAPMDCVPSAISGVTAPTTTSLNFANGEATFTLKHGQTLTLALPAGWSFTVAETLPATPKYRVAYEESATGTVVLDETVAVNVQNTRVYDITYELEGGTNDPDNPDEYTIEDDTITLKDPTRPGYHFGGWYADEDCTIPITEIPEGSTGDITVYAKWDPYAVTVEGSNADDDGTGEYPGGDTVTIKAGEPDPGYRFKNWTVDEGNVDLADPNNPTTTFTMPEEDVVITAEWEPVPYTITYVLDGGDNDPDNPDEYTIEDPTITFKDPIRPGYHFGGWFADEDCTIPITEIPEGSTGDITVYAKWDPYAVTVEGSNADDDGTGTYPAGEEVTIKAGDPDPGYRFKNWTVDEGDVDLADPTDPTTTFTMPYEDVVITAEWEPVPYTITYVLDGGDNDPDNPDEYTIEDPTITFKDPTRPGYHFGGWFADEDCTIPITEIPEGSTGDITVYAKWDPYEVSVLASFADESGAGEYPGGDTVTIDAGAPEPGMKFAGWEVVSGDVVLDDPSDPTTTFTMPEGDVVVRATWEPALFEVFVNDSYADETGEGTYQAGKPVTVNAGEREGYNFNGWEVEGDATLDSLSNPTAHFTMPYDDVTVTATWDPIVYPITYVLDGGTNDPDNPPSYTIEDETITFKDPTKPGYHFGGWFEDEDCTIPITEIPEGSTGPVTAYAKWDPYTATVEDSNADDDGTGDYPGGDTVTIKAGDPEPGMKFSGWEVVSGDVDLDDPTDPTTTFTMPDSDVVVKATWEPAMFEVFVNDSYADETGEGTYQATKPVTVNAGEREGYIFTGWEVEGDANLDSLSNPEAHFTMPYGDVSVTATWDPIVYPIIYELDGGTNDPDNPHTYTIEDPTVTFKDPTRPGYHFGGWFADPECTIPITEIPEGSTGEVTVYAKWDPYAVEVVNSNADDDGTGEYPGGDTVTIDAGDPERGMRFAGWKVIEGDVDLDDPMSPTTTFTMPDSNVVVEALWEPIDYTVTVNDSYADETGEGEYNAGDEVTINAGEREGYAFSGWIIDEGDVDLDDPMNPTTTFTMPYEDVVVTAGWNPIAYPITYELDGGTNDPDNPPTYTIEDPTITFKDPTRPGYHFYGWFADPECTIPLTEIPAGSTGPVTAYAKWDPYTVTVEDSNADIDGTGTYPAGSEVTLDAGSPEKGMRFAGWEVVAGDVDLSDPADPTATFTMPASDVVVKATWEEAPYTITYELDGGTNDPKNPNTYTISTPTIIFEDPTKPGYSFGGWFADPECTIPLTEIPEGSTGDVKAYAKWNPYTVSVVNSKADVDGSGEYSAGTKVTVDAGQNPSGARFAGWKVVSGDVTLSDPMNPKATFTMPEGDVVVEATWEPAVYDVAVENSYDPNNGEGPYLAGTTVTVKAGERPGYRFTGWTVDEGGVVLSDPANPTATFTMPDSAVKVTAGWEPITYDVTFVDWDGTVIKVDPNIVPGGSATPPPPPERPGFEFIGWDVSFNNITGDLTVTAQYRAILDPEEGELPKVVVENSYAPKTGAGSYRAGETVSVDAGERTGYRFTGWTVEGNATLSDPKNPKATFTMPDSDVKVIAGWEPIEYTVIFKDWDGNELGRDGVPYGGAATPPVPPERPGYTFIGWDLEYNYVTGDMVITALYEPIAPPLPAPSTPQPEEPKTKTISEKTGDDTNKLVFFLSVIAALAAWPLFSRQSRRDEEE